MGKGIIKYSFLLCILVLCPTLTACEFMGHDVQIFEEPDKYLIERFEDKDLKNDIFYVKDGGYFEKLYGVNINNSGGKTYGGDKINKREVAYTFKDEEDYIPSLYKDEYLAYTTEDTMLKDTEMLRYYDEGFSLGICGLTLSDDGCIFFNSKNNVIKGSDMEEKLKSAPSENIRISSINGEPAANFKLSESGLLTCFEEGDKVELGFYSGTKYAKETFLVDTHFYSPYEYYNLDQIKDTKNGYVSISFYKDAKAGFYMIDKGLFKYYPHTKTESVDDEDMNEAFYHSKEEQYSAYMQNYSVTVPRTVNNVGITIKYEIEKSRFETPINESEIYAIILSPSGISYEIKPENGQMRCNLTQAESGRWSINIYPVNLSIKDISVDSTGMTDDASLETFDFNVIEDDENIAFTIDYEGDGDVWGYVENENGEAIPFDEKKHKCTYPHINAGSYKAYVYHYNDTVIHDVKIGYDEENEDTDIIIVEG